MPDVNSIPFRQADPNGHYRSKQLPNDQGEFLEMLGLPAFAGDVVGPAGSTAGQAVVFSDGTGKRIDAATQTGLAKLASGVLSSVAAPIGAVVGTTDVQTLTNKTLVSPVITGTGIELQANKGVANGYASLDASTKVPMAQIPDALVGASQYQGTWNAATNTPAIPAAAVGNKGWYYSVSVAGTTNINGINSWAVGDQIISNGTVWQKIPNVSAVNSVNGQTGVVVLTKSDVGLGNVDNTSDATKNSAVATLTNKTLTSPAINTPTITSPTGLVKADVGLSNVDNTSDATKNAAAVTLTNKTINGANNTLTVRLANDVTGNLPVVNLNSGTGANSASFWRGDGQWAPPAGGGDVVGPAGGVVDGELVSYSGVTGKVIKASGGRLTASLVTGPASSVDNQFTLFSGTGGKTVKSGAVIPVGTVVGTTDTQQLSNKSFLTAAGITYYPSGVVYVNTAHVDCVTSTDTSFYKYTAPAGLLGRDGDALRITGTIVGNASQLKTPRFKLNGTNLHSYGTSITVCSWRYHVLIVRTGASAQKIAYDMVFYDGVTADNNAYVDTFVTAVSTAAPIDVELSGQAAVNSGALWGEQMTVEFLPAP